MCVFVLKSVCEFVVWFFQIIFQHDYCGFSNCIFPHRLCLMLIQWWLFCTFLTLKNVTECSFMHAGMWMDVIWTEGCRISCLVVVFSFLHIIALFVMKPLKISLPEHLDLITRNHFVRFSWEIQHFMSSAVFVGL